MKNFIISFLALTLISCQGDGSTFAAGGINQPGNLVSDTSSIASSGQIYVKIINNGQSSISVNNGEIHDNETADEIDINNTDCYGKTLAPNQTCKIGLRIYPGEAGISELTLSTSNGYFKFAINVDTSDEGVLDTDIKTLSSTKEQTINLFNKSSVPVTLTGFNTESVNQTLTVNDKNCLKSTLSAGKYCQLKMKASAGQNQHHTLFITTSNTRLKMQKLPIIENTTSNKLTLYAGESLVSVNIIQLYNPGSITYTVKNSGTNDINITKINFNSANIGSLVSKSCDGQILQAGDTCNILLNVSNSAYGVGQISATTAESLDSQFNYSLNVNTANLTADGSDSVDMHIHSSKTIKITNKNSFDIALDSISYDNRALKFYSDCSTAVHRIIHAEYP
ncbi:MAG: hypothetical protein K2P99_00180 [Burkholderiales bacterium]|nr:hypothetical protein [Burkholderiales bacterium]